MHLMIMLYGFFLCGCNVCFPTCIKKSVVFAFKSLYSLLFHWIADDLCCEEAHFDRRAKETSFYCPFPYFQFTKGLEAGAQYALIFLCAKLTERDTWYVACGVILHPMEILILRTTNIIYYPVMVPIKDKQERIEFLCQ